MQINKLLTPYNLNRLGDTNRIRYIVIHYVGATGGAEANCGIMPANISEPAPTTMWDLAGKSGRA